MKTNAGSLLIDGCCAGAFFSELAYARKEDKAIKAQPWKAHWAPVDAKSASANQNYLKDSTDSLLIDGACNGDHYFELSCARKETKAPKAQPWKTHWSPADKESGSASQNYLVDSTGTLLIDGSISEPNGLYGHSSHRLSELASACKETQIPKTQPWKAHWAPVDVKSSNGNGNNMVDDTGSLLIDGAGAGPGNGHGGAGGGPGSGYFFSQLACARK